MRHWPFFAAIGITVLIAIVVVTAALHRWWLGVATAVVVVAGFLSSSASERRRLRADPAFTAQEQLIRRLWTMTRSLPGSSVITDPLTGSGLSAERARGFLTLVVTDPPVSATPDQVDAAVVHRYALAFLGRLIGPPLFHDVTAGHGSPQRMSRRQAMNALELAEQTGVADTDPMDLAALVIQLDRALAAWRDGTPSA
jgi:hypothetical protein